MARVPDIEPELIAWLREAFPVRPIRKGETIEDAMWAAGEQNIITVLAHHAEVQAKARAGVNVPELDDED